MTVGWNDHFQYSSLMKNQHAGPYWIIIIVFTINSKWTQFYDDTQTGNIPTETYTTFIRHKFRTVNYWNSAKKWNYSQNLFQRNIKLICITLSGSTVSEETIFLKQATVNAFLFLSFFYLPFLLFLLTLFPSITFWLMKCVRVLPLCLTTGTNWMNKFCKRHYMRKMHIITHLTLST
jgi:hypothetical protein